MKRPFMNRFPVFEYNYQEKDLDITIYSCYQKTPNDWEEDEDENEDCDEQDDESLSRLDRDSREKNSITNKSLGDITLQSLLDNLPEGITPQDVKISMDIDCSDMAVEGTELTFYYKKKIPARPELFVQDKAAYDAEWAEYEKKEAAYKAWEAKKEIKAKQNEIKKLSEQLRSLKK